MSYVFVNFQKITFKIGTFSNLKALFLAKLTDFPQLVHHKSGKKKRGKVDCILHCTCTYPVVMVTVMAPRT